MRRKNSHSHSHPPSPLTTSSTPLPFRGQCIQVHGTITCGCPWFIPSASPPLLDQVGSYLSSQPLAFTPFQSSCAACGHGIHGHVDYVSMFVHCCVATQCAAYAQKTPQTQGCTCSAQLADHGLATNQYRPVDPSDIAGNFMDSVQVNGLSSKPTRLTLLTTRQTSYPSIPLPLTSTLPSWTLFRPKLIPSALFPRWRIP
ncbi:uncharacterized protein EV420DRAFT_849402 [Desarmillaria tabescens]|uniref:Uncharacterized protein n=1 Tax=Armillaria tabescens TaxID=1929756 RepID=A0AA39MW51_ARMTA|nr:uncharacterized protein EV420DRAFT_849402 [Desarmillaria tabescens]KAK0448264.1 hypothetical protein EV420DRAFT_849402 [Desarmillaria tabescens]